MTMTTTNDELIASAREYEDAIVGGEDQNWMHLVDLTSKLADALAAAPAPTEADRETLLRALANRLGEHPKAYIHRTVADKEETKLSVTIDVEDLAEFIAPAILPLIQPAPKTQDGEAREALARTVTEVTDLWPEPLDEVHDIPQIVNAILARYTLVPVSPEGGE